MVPDTWSGRDRIPLSPATQHTAAGTTLRRTALVVGPAVLGVCGLALAVVPAAPAAAGDAKARRLIHAQSVDDRD